MTTRTSRTVTELLDELRRQGATSAPPNRQAGRDASLDAEGARHLRCWVCSHTGQVWHALWLRGTYSAVCECPRCGAGERA